MNKYLVILLLTVSLHAQTKPAPHIPMATRIVGFVGSWVDVTNDTNTFMHFGGSDENNHLLFNEDYVVLQTHEVCASVTGYFMVNSQQGRYDVSFKGMRTYATFVFTTQYDAEAWAQRFCTTESLTSIKLGGSR